jgi:AraC-like DNA-binding protein
MKVQYKVTRNNTFLNVLHDLLGGNLLSEDELEFPDNHPIIKGKIVRYNLLNNVRVLICHDFMLKKPVTLERLSDDFNEFLLINIYLSNAPLVQRENNNLKIIDRSNEGLFLNSSNVTFSQDLPVGEKLTFINLSFDRELARNFLNPKEGDFFDIMTQASRKWAVYELLTGQLLTIAEQIVNIDMHKALGKLEMELKVLEFAQYSLKKVYDRGLKNLITTLNEDDLKSIYRIHELLIKDLSNPPTISALAKEAAMSESKLKSCFKHIYGDSIYQHYLNFRMEKAYQILKERTHSIGEVSRLLGYSNPSQFTKKFKGHFNILPHDVLKANS